VFFLNGNKDDIFYEDIIFVTQRLKIQECNKSTCFHLKVISDLFYSVKNIAFENKENTYIYKT